MCDQGRLIKVEVDGRGCRSCCWKKKWRMFGEKVEVGRY